MKYIILYGIISGWGNFWSQALN